MPRTEIKYYSVYRDDSLHLMQAGDIIPPEIIEGPDAIKEGCQRFDQIKTERAGWLLQLSMQRDFEDNMLVEITLRIGPEPFWSEGYLKEHSKGSYAYGQSK